MLVLVLVLVMLVVMVLVLLLAGSVEVLREDAAHVFYVHVDRGRKAYAHQIWPSILKLLHDLLSHRQKGCFRNLAVRAERDALGQSYVDSSLVPPISASYAVFNFACSCSYLRARLL